MTLDKFLTSAVHFWHYVPLLLHNVPATAGQKMFIVTYMS